MPLYGSEEYYEQHVISFGSSRMVEFEWEALEAGSEV